MESDMTLNELLEQIEIDSKIDHNRLDFEALSIPSLHAKYYRLFAEEARILKSLQVDFAMEKKAATHYYLGKAPDEEYQKKPTNIKVLKTDIDLYLDSDEELQALAKKVNTQKLKVETIENFLRTLNNRGYAIKTAVDFQKFQAGAF